MATISDIAKFIGSDVQSIDDYGLNISGYNSIENSKENEVTFCANVGEEAKRMINNSGGSLFIVNTQLKENVSKSRKNMIFVENPRLWFIKCVTKYFLEEIRNEIHPSAVILTKDIGDNVSIGPFCYVDRDVVVGNNTCIHNNVSILRNTVIGSHVKIFSGAVIGEDGFGYERDRNGELVKFPHVGGVEIGDFVEIGANTCIDRGTIDKTVIQHGTKIDNLVHVGHNAQVGKNCVIVANSLLGGSCRVGDNCHVSMSVTIRNGIAIGRGSQMGMGAVVTKSFGDYAIAYGNPAVQKNSSKHGCV